MTTKQKLQAATFDEPTNMLNFLPCMYTSKRQFAIIYADFAFAIRLAHPLECNEVAAKSAP